MIFNGKDQIKVKALAWLEDKGELFVLKLSDSVKGDEYYRAIGGTVEFGELTEEALLREVKEELNTGVIINGEPMILENLFVCDGEPGHEIDYLYPCKFPDPTFYERKEYNLFDFGQELSAMWVPVGEFLNGSRRLVPEELLAWYRTHPMNSEN